ncbi:hypothetical protein ACFPK9_13710 [Rubritalea spongiae]|uniref:Uncharacterized protein n=1 Tax=Rubritalea spongiae TaxID=430797 RepID=A0ABW5E1P3_9BACT
MEFLLVFITIIFIILPILIWILALRPYCRKHRQGYTPGATAHITLWIDWQHAREMAKKRGDKWIVFLSSVFFVNSILIFALIAISWAYAIFIS